LWRNVPHCWRFSTVPYPVSAGCIVSPLLRA
jgi:hypothetical protein